MFDANDQKQLIEVLERPGPILWEPNPTPGRREGWAICPCCGNRELWVSFPEEDDAWPAG